MNLLVDDLPGAVEMDGREFPLRTDYRTCIRTILAFEDAELTTLEKQAVLLENLYPEPPPDPGKAFELGVRFLNGGEPPDPEEEAGPRVFSFEKDANLIFAAFQQTHGIDLHQAELHWWQFLALFMDLGSETTFCNLVGLRKRVRTGKATKEERAIAHEMGELFDVPEPDRRTSEEKERAAEFFRLVAEGERQREQG